MPYFFFIIYMFIYPKKKFLSVFHVNDVLLGTDDDKEMKD